MEQPKALTSINTRYASLLSKSGNKIKIQNLTLTPYVFVLLNHIQQSTFAYTLLLNKPYVNRVTFERAKHIFKMKLAS